MDLVKSRYRWMGSWLLIGILIVLMYPYAMVFASEIGGYISEKLIERDGVGSPSLTIGTVLELTQESQIDVTMAPAVSTLSAQTSLGIHSATLRGNISTLNGFPSATVWFEWGYDTNYGNTVGVQTAPAIGNYTTTLTEINDSVVHYRFGTSADGTAYGNDSTFSLTKTPTQTLVWLIPTVFTVFGMIVLFMGRGKPVAVIVAGILIIIGVVIISNIAGVLW